MASDLVVRPAQLPDLLQVSQILNHWVATSALITRENPLTLVDIIELYRKVKAWGLPFLVTCPGEGDGFDIWLLFRLAGSLKAD